MPLKKQDREFLFPLVNVIDAKSIRVDRAFSNLLLLVKTSGRPMKASKKELIRIADLTQKIRADSSHFAGLDDDSLTLLARWIESDFADIVATGGGRGGAYGEPILAGLKPLHIDVTKLQHPRYARDFGTSRLLYNIISQSPKVDGKTPVLLDIFRGYFGIGSRDDHYDGSDLDAETLMLMRLLDHYDFDRYSLRDKEPFYSPLCVAETMLLNDDLMRLFVYQGHVPRRELLRYLLTITRFHLALYTFKVIRIINGFVEGGPLCAGYCRCDPLQIDPCPNCPYKLDIFVDLVETKSPTYELAQKKVQKHYAEMSRYLKSHLRLKKLDEFAQWLVDRGHLLEEERPSSLQDILALQSHEKVGTYFESRIESLLADIHDEDNKDRYTAISKMGLPALETFIEMLYGPGLRLKQNRSLHIKMLDSFCGKNQDGGFLFVGKGRAGRRYVLGTELLETLVQIAVIDYKRSGGHPEFRTKGLTISDFVVWLKNRYGILIDEFSESVDSVDMAQAMRHNYQALKTRLRQLGFYTDLSDASNTQLIQPRFRVISSQ